MDRKNIDLWISFQVLFYRQNEHFISFWSTGQTHSHGPEWSLFSHMSVHPSVFRSVRTFQIHASKTIFKLRQWSLLAGLWIWPKGSLTTPILFYIILRSEMCQCRLWMEITFVQSLTNLENLRAKTPQYESMKKYVRCHQWSPQPDSQSCQ